MPSDIFSWTGPTAHLTRQSKRIAAENKWFALTGRVLDLKVEADGDIHVALGDATGNKPGIVGVEVPATTLRIVRGFVPVRFAFSI